MLCVDSLTRCHPSQPSALRLLFLLSSLNGSHYFLPQRTNPTPTHKCALAKLSAHPSMSGFQKVFLAVWSFIFLILKIVPHKFVFKVTAQNNHVKTQLHFSWTSLAFKYMHVYIFTITNIKHTISSQSPGIILQTFCCWLLLLLQTIFKLMFQIPLWTCYIPCSFRPLSFQQLSQSTLQQALAPGMSHHPVLSFRSAPVPGSGREHAYHK